MLASLESKQRQALSTLQEIHDILNKLSPPPYAPLREVETALEKVGRIELDCLKTYLKGTTDASNNHDKSK